MESAPVIVVAVGAGDHAANAALLPGSVCAICHDSLALAQEAATPCVCAEAVFCKPCWDEYLARGYSSCPICRRALTAHAASAGSAAHAASAGSAAHHQDSEAFACGKVKHAFYYFCIMYSAVLVSMDLNLSDGWTERSIVCTSLCALCCLARRAYTGAWSILPSGDIVVHRVRGIRVGPAILMYSFYVDTCMFASAMAYSIASSTNSDLLVWTFLFCVFTAFVCSRATWLTGCGRY